MNIGVINLEISNLHSIINVLNYLGLNNLLVNKKSDIEKSDCLLIPGVGSFSYAVTKLKKKSLFYEIQNHVKKGKPIVGICLGFQLFFTEGMEFKKTKGLNFLNGKVKIFNKNELPNMPHIGWNNVLTKKNKKLFQDKKFYFIHSYYVSPKIFNDDFFYTKYGKHKFCSGVLKDNLIGFQFHPEKSGIYGIKLLSNIFNYAKNI